MYGSAYYKQAMDNLLASMAAKKQEHRSVADAGTINYPGGADAWVAQIELLRAQFYQMKGQLAEATQNYHAALETEKQDERAHQIAIAQTESAASAQQSLDQLNHQASLNEQQRAHDAIEAEKQRDHELQMALIHRDAAIAQAEAARLAAETTAKAQEQASNSLDSLIKGIKGDGEG